MDKQLLYYWSGFQVVLFDLEALFQDIKTFTLVFYFVVFLH